MRGLADVKRSLKELSKPIMGGMDIDVMVIESLSLTDNDFDLIAEFRGLYNSGFSAEEIEDMMGSESYDMTIAIIQRVEEATKLLTIPPLKKMVPTPKYRKRLVVELGTNLLCAPTIDKKREAEVIDIWDDTEGVDEDVDLE